MGKDKEKKHKTSVHQPIPIPMGYSFVQHPTTPMVSLETYQQAVAEIMELKRRVSYIEHYLNNERARVLPAVASPPPIPPKHILLIHNVPYSKEQDPTTVALAIQEGVDCARLPFKVSVLRVSPEKRELPPADVVLAFIILSTPRIDGYVQLMSQIPLQQSHKIIVAIQYSNSIETIKPRFSRESIEDQQLSTGIFLNSPERKEEAVITFGMSFNVNSPAHFLQCPQNNENMSHLLEMLSKVV